jgi:hypothetical protein
MTTTTTIADRWSASSTAFRYIARKEGRNGQSKEGRINTPTEKKEVRMRNTTKRNEKEGTETRTDKQPNKQTRIEFPNIIIKRF